LELPRDLVVHCHLRWSGVFQRPQHVISRLARDHRVLFIEEPVWIWESDLPHLAVFPQNENLTVLQPRVPAQEENLPAISASNRELIRALLSAYFREAGFGEVIRWHYAPMASYLADLTQDGLLVYDCMDELAAFAGAPEELKDRERELLRNADVVFTGGRSIFEAKHPHNPNTHRFDSAVDVEHFAQAALPETLVPADVADLPHPLVGYYGVVDERMDYPAIEAIAAAHPEWSIVLVGPVTKVDPAALPKAANIHYLGQRSYQQLPGYLKAFDVATVLFADNTATRHLSPTKTLEYFAGRKPVVTGPIHDILENYPHLVHIARSPQEWVSEIERALAEHDEARADAGVAYAREHTWDATVEGMRQLMREAYEQRNG
jgi:UDP-galactopyranose mutase